MTSPDKLPESDTDSDTDSTGTTTGTGGQVAAPPGGRLLAPQPRREQSGHLRRTGDGFEQQKL